MSTLSMLKAEAQRRARATGKNVYIGVRDGKWAIVDGPENARYDVEPSGAIWEVVGYESDLDPGDPTR